jgi:anthranilate synthase component 1
MLVVAQMRLDAPDIAAAYRRACERIDRTVAQLGAAGPTLAGELNLDRPRPVAFASNLTQAQFEDAVRRGKTYIVAGDIFQVVLSRRMSVTTAADPFDVYRALRIVNPSPFMFYVKSPGCILVGASPEILCRVEDGVITSRPLAGTRRRGESVEQDAALERELLADAKDRAEHIMLVDLGRNDVGRVSEPGSVRLSDVMTVERYSHVMHICSNVTGRLAAGRTAVDALRASLPVGTVSGAPKIRAMEIIDELEPVRRGPYGGAVGYLDFSGNMDTCIALRTMVVRPDSQSGKWIIDIQAGAGIVADSDPSVEFEETQNKARALLAAIEIADSA